MPLGLQAKLLRVLQEREVERVGAKKPIALDIRVLATSNRDMAAEVAAGASAKTSTTGSTCFRSTSRAARAPGRHPALARHFATLHAARLKRNARLSPDAELLLGRYHWPGNIRELENTMQRAQILASGEFIGADTVGLCLPQWNGAGPAPGIASPASGAQQAAMFSAIPANPAGMAPANMKDLEREHILGTLRAVGGSRKKAVEKLGISERTLRYKLQQYREEGHPID